ncbi:MAG: 2-amino-4-hydroxy-6-hydroxymethyldihydropteridine diphosphokinase [Selenomonadales bacterium]|jgi:2-amino-4-hydroxy-6-hydroxymethyldihydropteridine diphosphokinase|nr:2-amino-4-hydroxy-6-hydroxymethyldihydropteridine diphosphokinase [Selenomonadales bacterium]MBQ2114948.1 2-amino-4-hydroxy-6-hydroxymethyldihydropteridine diphosphokinase [Selenomonadales bacterium]MBQ5746048.1 2-amino-4-hydroxy-6-hydroxymethyldihydropteridine diphosphokinase [Selenomonadales bacterium]MBQ5832768.1 2-amino-4-hydroxy-6-hydroxymethyldihydropteridine diphosphokinase [Selenomonadales bacterium]
MIFIGLGSNLGDRKQQLESAIRELESGGDIRVVKRSSVYETEPFGVKDQPDFLNMVIAVETELSPEALLEECLKAEDRLGRVRRRYWGERTIDIDLLAYHQEVRRTPRLRIPHMYLPMRRFVLMPLAEIAGDEIIQQGKTADELLRACRDKGRVTKVE